MLEEKIKAGLILEPTGGKELQKENLAEEIVRHVRNHDLDILLGPEWLFLPQGRMYNEQEKNQIISYISENIKSTDALIIPGTIMWENNTHVHNTAPIIQKGTIREVHKFSDGGTKYTAKLRGCNKPKYKNFDDPKTFKWRDYKIGIEICSDMGLLIRPLQNKYLKDTGQKYWIPQMMEEECFLDFYFLVSSGIAISGDRDAIPLRKGGYGLNSNGNIIPESMVLRREQKGFTFPQCTYSQKWPDTQLAIEIYELTNPRKE
ncbi:hypothetical protein FJZ53_00090 [Candidatus Woesearchaeota archaeon]|nr:hypothetical protein [Candidatus Woesearchaeota archaeon]